MGVVFVGSATGEKAKSASEHAAEYGKRWVIGAQTHEKQLKGGIRGADNPIASGIASAGLFLARQQWIRGWREKIWRKLVAPPFKGKIHNSPK